MVLTPIEGAEPEDTTASRVITILAALLVGSLLDPMAHVLGELCPGSAQAVPFGTSAGSELTRVPKGTARGCIWERWRSRDWQHCRQISDV